METLLLCYANENDFSSCVRRATDNNINKQDYSGYTALMYATINRKEKLIAFIIGSGANLGLQSNTGNTALHYACMYGYFDIAILLINNMESDALQLRNISNSLPYHVWKLSDWSNDRYIIKEYILKAIKTSEATRSRS